MKQFLLITCSLIIFSSCTPETSWKNIVAEQTVASGDDPSRLIDASLASAKKSRHHKKHSSCRHYHKKRYE